MNKLKVGTRLSLAFGCMCALLLVTIAVGIVKLAVLNEGARQMAEDRLPKIEMAHSLLEKVDAIDVAARSMLLSTNGDDRRREARAIMDLRKAVDLEMARIGAMHRSHEEQDMLRQVAGAGAKFQQVQNKLIELVQNGDDDEAKVYLAKELRPVLLAYKAQIASMIDHQRAQVAAMGKDAEATYASSRNQMLGLGALAIVIACAVGYLITRRLLEQLGGEPDYAAAIAGEIAAGNLGVQVAVHPKDSASLMYAMDRMRGQLAGVVREVRAGADLIATASGEIAAGNQELSARTEQQAGSLEETASSLEQLTSTVRQNADNARQANQLASSASDVAAKGGAVVAQVVETMESINASARNIVDIISVIDGIAFQTNILALNAAVEAARAGEQGRGFAVVAAEVRVLAQRSAGAAKEIKRLIDNSVEQTGAGTRLVGEAGVTMGEIIDSIRQVADIMAEISAASAEQRSGIEQINMAVVQMDQVTQQNAALVEEAAAASASMRDQSASLSDTVSVFRLDADAMSAPRLVAAQNGGRSGGATGTPSPALDRDPRPIAVRLRA